MNVRLTEDAREQAEECDAWWRENRDEKRLFALELRDTTALIVTNPMLGAVYTVVAGKHVRRVLMPKTRHHLYYAVVDDHEIVIYAVWGAPKGQGPRL